jgi:hypothetical protein
MAESASFKTALETWWARADVGPTTVRIETMPVPIGPDMVVMKATITAGTVTVAAHSEPIKSDKGPQIKNSQEEAIRRAIDLFPPPRG